MNIIQFKYSFLLQWITSWRVSHAGFTGWINKLWGGHLYVFQDEVLAVSRKMVVRVEDLVQWSCAQPAGWSSLKPASCGTNGIHKPLQSSDSNSSNTANKSSEPLKDKTESKKHWNTLFPIINSTLGCHQWCLSHFPQVFHNKSLPEKTSWSLLMWKIYGNISIPQCSSDDNNNNDITNNSGRQRKLWFNARCNFYLFLKSFIVEQPSSEYDMTQLSWQQTNRAEMLQK